MEEGTQLGDERATDGALGNCEQVGAEVDDNLIASTMAVTESSLVSSPSRNAVRSSDGKTGKSGTSAASADPAGPPVAVASVSKLGVLEGWLSPASSVANRCVAWLSVMVSGSVTWTGVLNDPVALGLLQVAKLHWYCCK